jgi:hypothetical protein
MKFCPHGIGRETQTVTCDTVKDCVAQQVQKTHEHGQDIAVSLRDLKKKDPDNQKPTRGQSAEKDTVANSKEQAGVDIACQAELERHLDRKDALDHNLNKACALTCSTCCNKTIQKQD